MGTRMAPSYANLFMGKFEQHAIGNAPLKPFVWWRFIDDVFMIWTEGEEHLKDFIRYLNSIHASIKFTHGYSNSSHQTLPFLDVQVHLSNNHIQTDLHTKPTDKHQYLLKTRTTLNKLFHSAFSCESVVYALLTLSLINEAKNSSSTWSNVVIAAIPYKKMQIAYEPSHVTQHYSHKNRKPQKQTEHPSSYPSILHFPKSHLL